MKLTASEKESIVNQCQPLIEKFKLEKVSINPDKNCNYMVDIYVRWYRDYLHFCAKYKSESPDRMVDEFEDKFARLQIIGTDKFDVSYMRHTGQWNTILFDLTLSECLEKIETREIFHPMG